MSLQSGMYYPSSYVNNTYVGFGLASKNLAAVINIARTGAPTDSVGHHRCLHCTQTANNVLFAVFLWRYMSTAETDEYTVSIGNRSSMGEGDVLAWAFLTR
jgi:hypothetical protein